jgi:hypothetical protein
VLPTGRAAYVDSTKASAAGSILHMACTRAGIPWLDKTWKLNELERPDEAENFRG